MNLQAQRDISRKLKVLSAVSLIAKACKYRREVATRNGWDKILSF